MYRARAHSNPFNDPIYDVPAHPDDFDWCAAHAVEWECGAAHVCAAKCALQLLRVRWSAMMRTILTRPPPAAETKNNATAKKPRRSEHFPERVAARGGAASTSGKDGDASGAGAPLVRFADIGCGFGGLLIRLAEAYPDTLMVGLELRDKVAEYVRERLACLRHERPGQYQNASVLRTNGMKFLPNYFRRGQLTKMFFLFPVRLGCRCLCAVCVLFVCCWCALCVLFVLCCAGWLAVGCCCSRCGDGASPAHQTPPPQNQPTKPPLQTHSKHNTPYTLNPPANNRTRTSRRATTAAASCRPRC